MALQFNNTPCLYKIYIVGTPIPPFQLTIQNNKFIKTINRLLFASGQINNDYILPFFNKRSVIGT